MMGKELMEANLDEVRKISASAGILPKRVHGSALFQRGLNSSSIYYYTWDTKRCSRDG